MKTSDFFIAFILSILFGMVACQLLPVEIFNPDPPNPEPIVVVDTCEFLTPVDTPFFVGGYFSGGTHPEVTTYFYTKYDTMVWNPGETFADSFEKFLTSIWPQYEFYVTGDSPNNMGIEIVGSDDKDFWNRNIWYDNIFIHNSGFQFITRAIFLQGSASYEEFRFLISRLPSTQWINFNGPYDSIQGNDLARINLGDCKLGGHWVDFRKAEFTPRQTLIDSHILYMWDNVLQ